MFSGRGVRESSDPEEFEFEAGLRASLNSHILGFIGKDPGSQELFGVREIAENLSDQLGEFAHERRQGQIWYSDHFGRRSRSSPESRDDPPSESRRSS